MNLEQYKAAKKRASNRKFVREVNDRREARKQSTAPIPKKMSRAEAAVAIMSLIASGVILAVYCNLLPAYKDESSGLAASLECKEHEGYKTFVVAKDLLVVECFDGTKTVVNKPNV